MGLSPLLIRPHRSGGYVAIALACRLCATVVFRQALEGEDNAYCCGFIICDGRLGDGEKTRLSRLIFIWSVFLR
jgi:hypothetical protein